MCVRGHCGRVCAPQSLFGVCPVPASVPGRLIELGGDWDRRNRLKVYRATLYMATRDLDKAADLLLVRADTGAPAHSRVFPCNSCPPPCTL